MKRAFLLSFFALAGMYSPMAAAQSPAVCVGVYSGNYTGDFSGGVTGDFSLADTIGCASPPLGNFHASFMGSIAQFFYEDVARTEILSGFCVFDDLTFEDSGTASAFEGHVRQLFVSGTMDLNPCTLNGVWTIKRFDLAPPFPITLEGSGAFTISLEPESRQGVIWTATNGDFNNPENWQQQEIPNASQDAIFNQNLLYSVSFGSPASSAGFVVEQGFVTFLTGAYQATGGSEALPSAIVGNTANINAFLTLSNHHLTTNFSTFAPGPDTLGGVDVQDGSFWTEEGRMVIGGAGSATLDIADTGSVSSLETRLGDQASGEGEVELSSDDARWTTGNIAVGLRGDGIVDLRAGSVQSNALIIADQPGSLGTVTVGSAGKKATWDIDSTLFVGKGGIGRMNIVEGGYVLSTTSGLDFVFVGGAPGSSIGNLRVEGASSTLDVPNHILSLGGSSSGNGFVTVKNEGEIKCRSAHVFEHGSLRIEDSCLTFGNDIVVGNQGTIAMANGLIDSVFTDTEMEVESGGTVTGTGSIDVTSATLEGTVAPGVVIADTKGAQGLDDAIGTLTFGGNVNFSSAVIEIDVGGLAEGNFDVIHATGAVDIQDSTVLFRFVDGFLPRTGDIVPFLVADGGVTIENLALEFEGVSDGFQFEVTEENGMLVFEALNDAQPIPIPSADLDKDGEIDFFDLLNFIQQMNGQQ